MNSNPEQTVRNINILNFRTPIPLQNYICHFSLASPAFPLPIWFLQGPKLYWTAYLSDTPQAFIIPATTPKFVWNKKINASHSYINATFLAASRLLTHPSTQPKTDRNQTVYNSLTQNHTKKNLTLNTSDYYLKTNKAPAHTTALEPSHFYDYLSFFNKP